LIKHSANQDFNPKITATSLANLHRPEPASQLAGLPPDFEQCAVSGSEEEEKENMIIDVLFRI